MEDDDDLVPLAALQHWLVCPRQCALIHVERIWMDNALTAEGHVLHTRVDQGGAETRGPLRRVWALPLRSVGLGLVGVADCVEFVTGPDGAETPLPVEHKRGRPKADDRDRVQLCAQALCLEEMTGRTVPEGELFYHATRQRLTVPFDAALRRRTIDAAEAVRTLIASGRTPPPPLDGPDCPRCSLADLCLPHVLGERRSAEAYFRGAG